MEMNLEEKHFNLCYKIGEITAVYRFLRYSLEKLKNEVDQLGMLLDEIEDILKGNVNIQPELFDEKGVMEDVKASKS